MVVSLVALAARLPLDVPVQIGREDAQRLARIELAKPEYHTDDESIVSRALHWLIDWISQLGNVIPHTSPLGWFGLLGFAIVVALVVIAVRRQTGPLNRARRGAAVLDTEGRGAGAYRAEADRFAAEGAWAEAVRSRLRAIVGELEERGHLDVRPGRTADEIARDAGAVLPSVAGELREGARLFDDIWYGERGADAGDYERMVALDAHVSRAEPGIGTPGAEVLAAPR
jgi:hypothetical protein